MVAAVLPVAVLAVYLVVHLAFMFPIAAHLVVPLAVRRAVDLAAAAVVAG